MSVIANIIRNATRTPYQPLNILVAPYNNTFELSLSQGTPHHFYLLYEMQIAPGEKVLDKKLHYLSTDIKNWSISLDLDLIICNDITTQISSCSQISKILHIPLLIIHHFVKPDFVKNEDIQILKDNSANDTIVSMSEEINDSWYANFPVMPHPDNAPAFTDKWNNLFNDISQKPFIG